MPTTRLTLSVSRVSSPKTFSFEEIWGWEEEVRLRSSGSFGRLEFGQEMASGKFFVVASKTSRGFFEKDGSRWLGLSDGDRFLAGFRGGFRGFAASIGGRREG